MVIGLTGNYGMGKSFVLSVFKELGAIILDSDDIVHRLLQDRTVVLEVRKILGDRVVKEDGTLDKGEVANIIFDSSELRKKIETLLHPLVLDSIESSLRKIREERLLVVVEVPLLFECGYQNRFSRTITVFTSREEALRRLMKNGVARGKAMKRLQAQMPIRTKKKKADYLIDNSGTRRSTRRQVETIYKKLLAEIM
jgi:dephospho-CoA kinase